MNISLEDFIPEILDPEDDIFSYRLANRYEFARYGANETEKFPLPGKRFPHQDFAAIFYSIYKRGLIVHQPGTGKSCLATAVAETLKTFHLQDINEGFAVNHPRVYVVGMPSINSNFKREIVCRCTNNEYINRDDEKTMTVARVNKALSEHYIFMTLSEFKKFLSEFTPDGKNDSRIEGCMFIIDEIHNFVIESAELGTVVQNMKERKEVYSQTREVFTRIPSIRALLLTGTPMRNTPNELALILNLILPKEKQFKTNPNESGIEITKANVEQIWARFKGIISYLRETKRNFSLNYVGVPIEKLMAHSPIDNMKNKVYPCKMRDFQKNIYYNVLQREGKRYVYSNVRRSAIMVYPDENINSFKKYIDVTDNSSFNLKQSFKDAIGNFSTPSEFAEKLAKFSAKFSEIAKYIIKNPKKKGIVYQEFKFQGVFPLVALLSYGLKMEIVDSTLLKGFREDGSYCGTVDYKNSIKLDKRPRIAFLVPSPHLSDPNREALISIYNSKENYDGSIISWLVFSPVGREGLSFKDVTTIVTDSSWSFSIDEQARRRGIRANSHDSIILETKGELEIDIIQLSIDLGKEDNKIPDDSNVLKFDEDLDDEVLVDEGDTLEGATRIGDNPEYTENISTPKNKKGYPNIYNIDLYMYIKAEEKERTIRPFRKLYKEMSYDAFVHRRRNQQNDFEDGTVDCDYTTCTYKCYTVNSKDRLIKVDPMKIKYDMDYSWFWSHPDQDITESIKEFLKSYFLEYNMITFEEIQGEIGNYPLELIMASLFYMAETMEIFENRLGYEGFLAFSNNAVALVPRPNSKFEEYKYFEELRFQIATDNINTIIDTLVIDEKSDKLENIFYGSSNYAIKFLQTATHSERNYLLERSFLISDNEVAEVIREHYEPRLFYLDNLVISTLKGIDLKQKHSLIGKILNPEEFRIFDNKKWRDPLPNEISIIKDFVIKSIQKRESHLENEPIYGFIIVDDTRGLMIYDGLSTEKARGVACREGLDANRRAQLFYHLDIDLDINVTSNLSISEKRNILDGQYKIVGEDDENEIDYLYKFLLWKRKTNASSRDECDIIMETLKERGLLVLR